MIWIMTIAGLILLVLAGDALVKGAVNTSLRLGIPPLIVSLTIVGFGTSAPELLVSLQSMFAGVPELALGNVVGSNVANVLLILGVPALISVMHTSEVRTRNSYLQMLAMSVIFIALCWDGMLNLLDGLILAVLMLVSILHSIRVARRSRYNRDEEEVEGADDKMSWAKIAFFLVAGIVGLPLGAQFLINGATAVAEQFGVPEAVIGLTLVALGTSLPELATTVMAAIRKQADVAIGNVIGSNMFNIGAILGITAMTGNIPVSKEFMHFDLWVMLAASLVLIPFVFMRVDIGRVWGAVLTALYVTYIWVLL
ncbi:calcium/sodium antiporter [Marivivens donghaensis]|uniref:Calcium/sodium antiporter n=1 Tax=Marivivens donghaensis TaxID=1699413 RepID=A0ABX0W3M5_9RHOB|nr:calcium/sodium antiporter [Marivivens donghaensis]NIY73542.1 calcium/sodium antiporter [Marivivens donghaensis]